MPEQRAPRAHRWTVDGIEEGVARIEVDGDTMRTVPIWILPHDAQEGDVLRVTHARAADSSALTIERDVEATEQGRARSAAQVTSLRTRSRAHDAGGDVTL